ncbi:MAG: galactose oxidase early set domain-containing protein, partial [Acidobacteria bacterium]|nr:galactose oxidase early set domain-containing protein [Acidobacteriota bacterium]
PYLFTKDAHGNVILAARPEIHHAPDEINLGDTFEIRVRGNAADITSVAMSRNSPITHNWAWGNRMLILSIVDAEDDEVTVRAPNLTAQAIPGDYMLFVVNTSGVPSKAKHVRVRLNDDDDADDDKDRDKRKRKGKHKGKRKHKDRDKDKDDDD